MIRRTEFTVVVTGCGPFKSHEANPSQKVKNNLPDRIEREGYPTIRIIKYPLDFRNVITDMEIIPTLWNQHKSVYDPKAKEDEEIYVDAILHLGMNNWTGWQLEKRARRDGYDWVGDDGVPLPEHNGGKGERWEGLPEELNPVFDVEKIVGSLNEAFPNLEIESSTDAGLLYCEFIFYTSLATLYRRGEKQRTLFMHVPGKKDTEEGVADGVKVASSVICSLVEALR